jgi:hypothetical protein
LQEQFVITNIPNFKFKLRTKKKSKVSREDLQFLLDRTKEYINMKQLSLNVKKSVFVVFRKGGKITSRNRVKWEGIDLESRKELRI